MINSELGHVKTLDEFYRSIIEQQEAAHGEEYCAMHEAIVKYFKEGNCKTYMELGTHQGGTAACAMRMNPKKVILVDISMQKYNKFLRPIATEYCSKNNIELVIKETDSTGLGAIDACDMLMIDSVHKAYHMEKELMIHAPNTTKYIVAHDTCRPTSELHNCLENFCMNNPRWKVIERNTNNVGYTVLGKT